MIDCRYYRSKIQKSLIDGSITSMKMRPKVSMDIIDRYYRYRSINPSPIVPIYAQDLNTAVLKQNGRCKLIFKVLLGSVDRFQGGFSNPMRLDHSHSVVHLQNVQDKTSQDKRHETKTPSCRMAQKLNFPTIYCPNYKTFQQQKACQIQHITILKMSNYTRS